MFPLPAGAKSPPPAGVTGWDGVDLSGADCAELDNLPAYGGTAQTAVRMPTTVVGVDVDAYDGKTGAATVAEAVHQWGTPPGGPWSSARDDGESGIRFYRVPDGTVLVPNLVFPEMRIGHVELIQRHHRFAVVWPSTHPRTGTRYTWRGTAGPDVPPALAELPELPAAWLAGLAGTGHTNERARPEQVARFLDDLPTGAVCEAVRAAVRSADGALRCPVTSRHDDTCAHVLRLLRLGERGHPGTAAALAALQKVFVRTVTADGSRTAASARAEFDRMIEGANGIGLIEASPTPPERRGCRCGQSQPAPTRAALTGMLRTALNAPPDKQPALLAWATRKLRGYAAAGQLPPEQVERIVGQLRAATSSPSSGVGR